MSSIRHTIKRAIIVAAGKGERMRPLTFNTPKPLIEVKGKAMICSVIEGLLENSISEIYVVVGYLKEQFEFLQEKYSEVTLVENPYYDTCNNISSLYMIRDKLCDCIILDGDQIIYNPDILSGEFELSGYNAVWCEGETNEWLMEVENGIVKSCSRTGGKKGWQLYSISRWSEEDGKKLKKYIEKEFESGNTDIYWDDVAMFLYFNDFKLGIRPMQKSDIVEIDDIDELIKLDPTYKKDAQ